MRVPRSGAIAIGVILSLSAAACSKSSTASTSTTTAGAGTPTTAGGSPSTAAGPATSTGAIHIMSFKFVPTPAQAKVGDKITVSNDDGTDHSLTAVDGSFDTGVFSSGTKTITLSKAGTFAIHCRIHSFMTGSIVVSP